MSLPWAVLVFLWLVPNSGRYTRAAVLHDTTEARLTRAHNDANVACFGARLTGEELALDALKTFLADRKSTRLNSSHT